jgi:hypothetical protein
MEYDDTLIKMFAVLPKKFDNFDKDFDVLHEKEFYGCTKLKNEEDKIDEAFSSEYSERMCYKHYTHCFPK